MSVLQPWASLIALGSKTIETRAHEDQRYGPLAILAHSRLSPIGGTDGLALVARSEPFSTYLDPLVSGLFRSDPTNRLDPPQEVRAITINARRAAGSSGYGTFGRISFPLGAVVAVVNYVHNSFIDETYVVPALEEEFGDYTSGRYAYEFDGVVPVEPSIPVTEDFTTQITWVVPPALAVLLEPYVALLP